MSRRAVESESAECESSDLIYVFVWMIYVGQNLSLPSEASKSEVLKCLIHKLFSV